MDGQVNCMHSKLMLLFHPNYLRIVIPSANLVPYDWGEAGGVMENVRDTSPTRWSTSLINIHQDCLSHRPAEEA